MVNSIQSEQYQAQLGEKKERFNSSLAPFAAPHPTVFASPPTHYRYRAELRVWHQGDDLSYIMFDKQTKQKIFISTLPIASKLINTTMPALLAELKDTRLLRYKLFQVDFLSTQTDQLLITLIYHKKLDEDWQVAATKLRQRLISILPAKQLHIIGRAKGQKINLHQDFVVETIHLQDQTLHYQQIENSFTQPNPTVATHMLNWAKKCTQNSTGDLLELYCGNGNFSIALANNFGKVLATEVSKSSVNSAQYNIKLNAVHHVEVVRMSAEEFTQAMNKTRQFRRLEHVDLDSYQCNTILVDPPRCGLDAKTIELLQHYPAIVYISCNLDTLADNLSTLTQTHTIIDCALFDQFPYTDHIEAGVYLFKK
ncbi:MAG: tRNA (uridine(54)-C5)-methyltransferase TrmA [Shewanellaceae bacterium]|nr:tRNA (uridine(54)-C5)-methyltransferase TrmA [Shewanellaceae bacterium]